MLSRVSAQWSLSSALSAGRHRLLGFTVSTLAYLSSVCAKDIITSLLALSVSGVSSPKVAGAWPVHAIAPSTSSKTELASTLYRVLSGTSIHNADATSMLLSVFASSLTGPDVPVNTAFDMLTTAVDQFASTARIEAYKSSLNPPPSERSFESLHEYLVCRACESCTGILCVGFVIQCVFV